MSAKFNSNFHVAVEGSIIQNEGIIYPLILNMLLYDLKLSLDKKILLKLCVIAANDAMFWFIKISNPPGKLK